jgi:hypothetical protein
MMQRTPGQEAVIQTLTNRFEIDEERILFLNPARPEEPWIPPEELMSIARQAGGFKSIGVTFDQFIQGLNQVAYTANVTDAQDRIYVMPGVATVGEKHPVSGEVLDEHSLARGRAVSAALRAAGFYPLKAGSTIDLNLKLSNSNNPVALAAEQRNSDLAQIHLLAAQKGLIREGVGGRKELSGYKNWLFENWGIDSAGALNTAERQSAINALKQMPDAVTASA